MHHFWSWIHSRPLILKEKFWQLIWSLVGSAVKMIFTQFHLVQVKPNSKQALNENRLEKEAQPAVNGTLYELIVRAQFLEAELSEKTNKQVWDFGQKPTKPTKYFLFYYFNVNTVNPQTVHNIFFFFDIHIVFVQLPLTAPFQARSPVRANPAPSPTHANQLLMLRKNRDGGFKKISLCNTHSD